MDILDCPIKDLPSKGGKFTNLKREISTYVIYLEDSEVDQPVTIRRLLKKPKLIKYMAAGALNNILNCLIEHDKIKY